MTPDTMPAKAHKVKQPRLQAMEEMFERVRHLKYVVISNWQRLPIDPIPITILTLKDDDFLALWDLTFVKDNRFNVHLSTGKSVEVTILEQGKNVFPHMFESRILDGAVLHNDVVKVPSVHDAYLVRLYWKLMYQGFMGDDPEERQVALDYIRNTVGPPIRPRYSFMANQFDCGRKVQVKPVEDKDFISRP